MQGSSSLDGRVAVVTGAGAGLGRAEALALARAGADLVLADVSDDVHAVVDEAVALGVKATAVVGDVSEAAVADRITATAVERFGGLHVLVNNAGVLRDRMLFKMTDREWDDVIRVHLRGHFLLSRNAAAHWRDRHKQTGENSGSVVNTASEAFLLGAAGQPNYAAAKAGIAALTVSTARALARYGVRANAICPRARTSMTADVFGPAPETGTDPLSTDHVAPFVAFLAGPGARDINGQVFVVHSGMIALMSAPAVEQRFDTDGPLWTEEELERAVGGYFADRDPQRTFASDELMNLP